MTPDLNLWRFRVFNIMLVWLNPLFVDVAPLTNVCESPDWFDTNICWCWKIVSYQKRAEKKIFLEKSSIHWIEHASDNIPVVWERLTVHVWGQICFWGPFDPIVCLFVISVHVGSNLRQYRWTFDHGLKNNTCCRLLN